MIITRRSMWSGKVRTLDINVTQEQLDNFAAGAKIQDAFPNCSATEREFIKTGITDNEWDDMNSGELNISEGTD